MGYTLVDNEPYIITGKSGKEYKIPSPLDMDLEAIEITLRYNKAEDEIEKVKLCKEFFLHFAPDLEDEGIGYMQYFDIFQKYNAANVSSTAKKKKLGES